MEVNQEQLLKLTKDLAEGVLRLRIQVIEQEGRIARLEHVISNPQLARPSESILYAQRDIIGE